MTGLLEDKVLFSDLKKIIDSSRENVAKTINSEITLLYWKIGERINTEILQEKRAEYGKQILKELAKSLTFHYGSGWSDRHLRYCVQLSEVFPELKILHTVCAKLTWSHLKILINIGDSLKRDFYIEICQIEGWSVRQLKERIDSMLYERTAISKKPEKTIESDIKALKSEANLSADLIFRDPYFLDFLGLQNTYSEKDDENSPIGLILCAGKNEEHIELLQLDKSNIKVAEYITQLPDKKILQEKLHKSLELARNKLLITELDKEENQK